MSGQHQRLVRTPESLHRRPGVIRGQIDNSGGAGQLLLPIGNLGLQDFTLQPLPLPVREIRILNGQRGQRRRFAGAKGDIERRQLSNQYSRRPTVGDNMVHRQQPHLLLVAQPQHGATYQRPLGQIEGQLGFGGDQSPDLGLPLARRQLPQVNDRQLDRQCRGDHLRGASLHIPKGGAQGFVARDDFIETPLQRRQVERPLEADGGRNVVGREARFQLIEEP